MVLPHLIPLKFRIYEQAPAGLSFIRLLNDTIPFKIKLSIIHIEDGINGC